MRRRRAHFAFGNFACREVADCAKQQPGDLRFEERCLDTLTCPGAPACNQRQQDGLIAVHRGADIAHRNARSCRRRAGRSRHVHDADESLHDRIVRRLIPARPAVAESGNRAIDEARVDLAHNFVINAKTLRHAASVIFDQYVGGPAQFEQGLEAFRGFQIEHDRALVTIDRQKFGALIVPEGRAPRTHRVAGR